MKKKGQASTETLTLYVGIVLSVLLVLGALAYFGLLNPRNFLPSRCEISQDIECIKYQVGTNAVKLLVKNNLGHGVEVLSVNIVEANNRYETTNKVILDKYQEAIIIVDLIDESTGESRQKKNFEIEVNYVLLNTGIQTSVKGKIFSRIEGNITLEYYRDADGDGYGDISISQPEAGEGYVVNANDCDDNEALCNIDCATRVYIDNDNDGYGNNSVSARLCDGPEEYIRQSGDCDDSKYWINPGEEELCDGIENNCDGRMLIYEQTYSTGYEICDDGIDTDCDGKDLQCCDINYIRYWDEDNDGYGDPRTAETVCEDYPNE